MGRIPQQARTLTRILVLSLLFAARKGADILRVSMGGIEIELECVVKTHFALGVAIDVHARARFTKSG